LHFSTILKLGLITFAIYSIVIVGGGLVINASKPKDVIENKIIEYENPGLVNRILLYGEYTALRALR